MHRNFRILIVDDEKDMRDSLRDLLTRDEYQVDVSSNGDEALRLYKNKTYDLVISDIIMPEMDGIALLKKLKDFDQEASVILITGYSSIQGAISAIKLGAEDYFTKPFKAIEIKKVIRRIYDNKYLSKRTEQLTQGILRSEFSEIIGNSKVIRDLKEEINTVADSEVSVLVTGESGTGKELVARAIHQASSRKDRPFVPINCAAVPNDLLESEFFGHEKGAFSGALKRKYGIFEVADTGTLFLDEIGEMPLHLQSKLLRTVETKKIRRIGGTDEIDIDIRILCSTNRDLKQEIKKGNFREDLYFRLATFNIHIAPLKARREDIPILIDNFVRKKRIKKLEISIETENFLYNYNWPGNVRELENVLERLILIAKGNLIIPDHLPIEIRNQDQENTSFIEQITRIEKDIEPLENIEKKYIIKAYKHYHGNKAKTAKKLGIGLKTLYRKLEKYQIES